MRVLVTGGNGFIGGHVIDCLSDENHLGALGAFVGLDEDMARLRVFLDHMARITESDKANYS